MLTPLASSVVLIIGSDAYNFIRPTVCTVVPKVTIAEVAYGSQINVTRTISARNAPAIDVGQNLKPDVFVATLPLFQFKMQNLASQSLTANGLGVALSAVYGSRPESNGTVEEQQQLVNTLLVSFLQGVGHKIFKFSLQEGYLTGVYEMSASVSCKIILLASVYIPMSCVDSACGVLS